MPLPQVHHALKYLAMSRSRFLYGIDCVPEERLDWSPGGEAPTPLQLAGKTARFLAFVTHVITHRAMPERSGITPDPPTTREAAKMLVEERFGALRHTLLGVTGTDLAATVPVPWGEATIEYVIANIPAIVGYHQGQMNLIQLCYGDKDPNVPPNWGQEEI